jgi:hypothetical protein
MKYLLPILCILLLSCASFEVSMCRHRAVECALVYGEKVGNDKVGIAIGPSSTVWHGQAYILNPMRWIVHNNDICKIGSQEDFKPQIFMTTAEFMKMQFPWVK